MLWNPAAIAAVQAATASRLGVLNIDGWCLLIIITTSLIVNYCYGLLLLKVSVTVSSFFKLCIDAQSASHARFKCLSTARAIPSGLHHGSEQVIEPLAGLHATEGHKVQTVFNSRLASECLH